MYLVGLLSLCRNLGPDSTIKKIIIIQKLQQYKLRFFQYKIMQLYREMETNFYDFLNLRLNIF